MNFYLQTFFNDINHGYKAALLKENFLLYGWFPFIWMWLLIAIMKRRAERRTLWLYHTSLSILILFQMQSWIILWVKVLAQEFLMYLFQQLIDTLNKQLTAPRVIIMAKYTVVVNTPFHVATPFLFSWLWIYLEST